MFDDQFFLLSVFQRNLIYLSGTHQNETSNSFLHCKRTIFHPIPIFIFCLSQKLSSLLCLTISNYVNTNFSCYRGAENLCQPELRYHIEMLPCPGLRNNMAQKGKYRIESVTLLEVSWIKVNYITQKIKLAKRCLKNNYILIIILSITLTLRFHQLVN